MDILQDVNEYQLKLKHTLEALNKQEISKFIEILLKVYENNKTVYIFGNGGSASTASHFACDINKAVSETKKKLKVVSLADNIPIILAYANDVNFEDIFIEQLKTHLEDGDIVIGISGSGNSKNVLKAIEYANSKGNITIGITGYDGGILKQIAIHSINANINDMQISEDIHMILTHLTRKLITKIISSNNSTVFEK